MIQIKIRAPLCRRLYDLCGGMSRDGGSPHLQQGEHDGDQGRPDEQAKKAKARKPPTPSLSLGQRPLPGALQKGVGIEFAKNVDQAGDDPGPTRLMAAPIPASLSPWKYS